MSESLGAYDSMSDDHRDYYPTTHFPSIKGTVSASSPAVISDSEQSITTVNQDRPDWDSYFINIAKAVSERADCRRAKHGAVVVNDRRIVATGYNAAEANGPSCLKGECPRGLKTVEKQQHNAGLYEDCISQHAELNALLYAGVSGAQGGTLYVTGEPCRLCRKVIRAAGIARVVWMYRGDTETKHEWELSYGGYSE